MRLKENYKFQALLAKVPLKEDSMEQNDRQMELPETHVSSGNGKSSLSDEAYEAYKQRQKITLQKKLLEADERNKAVSP